MSSSSTDVGEGGRLPGLDYRFDDPRLLRQALTHRSLGNPNNERLEFLGDAVLNFTVAEMLFHERPDVSEGDLTRLRARLVRGRTLAEIARELDLGDHLRLGPGELKSGGFLRESILADALEAILGAAFLDGGLDAVRAIVATLMRQRLDDLPDGESVKDSKTRLQELLQARGMALPDYRVVDESGADHQRRFTVRCTVPLLDRPLDATATSRRKAEQAAARAVLDRIEAQS